MSTGHYSTHRPAGREHFPEFPKGFIAIRIVQLVLAVVILGLCGFGVTFLVFAGDALSLFSAIATLIVTIYHIVAQFGSPKLYNYWAVLGLDIFLLIFWLISFAVLAAQVAPAFSGTVACDYYSGYCAAYSLSGIELVYVSCLAAAAGLGGVQFILFVVSLSIVGVKVHRHRAAGLHCSPASSSGHNNPTISAPSQIEKGPMEPQVQPAYQQQQHQQQQQQQQQQPMQPMQPHHSVQQPHAGVPAQPTPPPQAHAAPQQQLYPQQAASPLSAQPTGGSYHPPQYQQPPMPGHPQGPPYEANGHTTQHNY